MSSTDLVVEQTPAEMLEVLAAQRNPRGDGTGRRYPPEVIERALLECAAQGDKPFKAAAVLTEMGIPVTGKRVSAWRLGTYRERYEEICATHAAVLQEKVARDALSHAQGLQDGEREALKQALAGLSDTNAVEASTVLRNFAQAKQIALQSEAALRGRAGLVVEVRGLEDITKAILDAGVASVIDSTAVEEESHPTP